MRVRSPAPCVFSLIANASRYNLFYIDEPWVGDYFWLIKRAFHEYIKEYDINIEDKLWIHSWANCFRQVSGCAVFHTTKPS